MATMIDFDKRQDAQPLVNYRAEDGIAVIELDNPPANTYTYDLMRQLDEAIVRARFDDDVYVLVITGQGNRFFSAGANIGMMQRVTPRFLYQFSLYANETLNRLEHTPKLTIAALNGHTVGGGLEMALACDVRIAKQGASRIGLPEVNLGVLPGLGGTQRLAKVVGKSVAIEMMARGQTSSFEHGKELGLINEIFAAQDYSEQVALYARQFCPPHKAARAVGLIKRAVQSGAELPLASGQALERELQQQLFQSADAREGIAAFNDKRMALFTAE